MAKSEQPPLISLCMIVRDEEQRLAACLRSVRGLVDEVVLVDTGSSDATMELARELGCRLFEQPWQDDFSKARNASLEHARGAWVLILDADEVLSCEDGFDLRAILREEKDLDFGMLKVITPDHTGEREEVRAIRLFRNGRGYRFRYPVHEQIDIRDARGRELPVGVLHLGCLDEARTRARQARYLEMLSSLPENDPHRIVFSLRSLVSLGRWEEVEPLARRAIDLLPPAHTALPRLLFQAAVAAFNRDDRGATSAWLRRGLARYPDHPDIHFVAMAHEAWLSMLAHQAVRDPEHPLFRQVGDSSRWLGAIEAFLSEIRVRGGQGGCRGDRGICPE